jgi:hypothetical protein
MLGSGSARFNRTSVLLGAIVALSMPVQAADEPLADRFSLEVGAFFITNTKTEAELTRSFGPIQVGGAVDFNQDLGLSDSETVPRIDGYYRFGRRSSFDFTWFDLDRDATTFLGEAIEFGEISIPVGEEVYSFFNQTTVRASYGYSFYNVPKAEIGITAGLHFTSIDLGIECLSCLEETKEAASLPAPLPVVGIHFRYQITPRWRFAGYTQHFMLAIGGVEGSFSDTRFTFAHHTFKNVGFGFGWNRIDLDVEADTSDYLGAFDTRLDGLQAFVSISVGKAKYGTE